MLDEKYISQLVESVIKNMPASASSNATGNQLGVFDKMEDALEAVKKAYEVTTSGKSCLLSPAAASYEAFKNFEEKGRKYKEYIDLYK